MYQLKFFQRTLRVKFKSYFPEILVIKCDYRLCRGKCRHLGMSKARNWRRAYTNSHTFLALRGSSSCAGC